MKLNVCVQDIKHCTKRGNGGWYILKTDRGIAKGTIGWEVGEHSLLQLEGEWGLSKFNGEKEFSFKRAQLAMETDSRSLLKLAIIQTKGLGEAKEEAIWAVYGEDWRNSDLEEIPGLRQATRDYWKDTLRRLDDMSSQVQAQAWLLSKGCTIAMANAAWAKWGEETQGRVQANPYALANLPHFSFHHVDGFIASNFGIAPDDDRRFDAAVLYVMGNITESSKETITDESDVHEQVMKWCADYPEKIGETIKRLVEQDKLVRMGSCIALEADYMFAASIYNFFT